MKNKVLIINTGGTIGMVHSDAENSISPLRPAKNWAEITKNCPMLKSMNLGVETDYVQFDPLLDSSDLCYENWVEMAKIIEDNYDKYSGFVLLHGTDTMSYTASALSFMMENLSKPIIITGSQVPIVKTRNDALQNLITSIHIAAPKTFGYPVVPEVCIFFRDKLYRGNRCRKISSSGYSGIDSPNYPHLAKAGVKINFFTKFIHSLPDYGQQFYTNANMDTRVMVIEIFPGFDAKLLRNIYELSDEKRKIQGLILKTYGAGNAPNHSEFLDAIEYLTKKKGIIVNVTQCPEGTVEIGMYESSLGLLNRGVISGLDMTPNAAVCKIMHLLGQELSYEAVKRMMLVDLRGEQSMNIYNLNLGKPMKKANIFKSKCEIPGYIQFRKLKYATLRIQNMSIEKGKRATIKVFINHPNANENTASTDPRCVGFLKPIVQEDKENVDFILSVTPSVKKLLKSGMIALISIISIENCEMDWDNFYLSLTTEAL